MSQREVIDGLRFARGGGLREGVLDQSRLPRLTELNCATDGLAYSLRGELDPEGRSVLGIAVSGGLRLACQRCLGPLEIPIALEVHLVLVTSRREIEEADDDFDRVLAGKTMEVDVLVEDEVMLALPMAPRHEHCEASGMDTGAAGEPRFWALARLRRGG